MMTLLMTQAMEMQSAAYSALGFSWMTSMAKNGISV